MAEHCRDTQPWCWPSLDVLEDETGYSRSALLRATAALDAAAFVIGFGRIDLERLSSTVAMHGLFARRFDGLHVTRG